MHRSWLAAAVVATALLNAPSVAARPSAPPPAKPWCGPNVATLSDHVCYLDGGKDAAGRRTLVIYLHGILAKIPGFQYVQQRWMAQEAKSNSFTLLIPTAPSEGAGYAWPTTAKALAEKEAGILAGIKQARAELEEKMGTKFDETFIVGFSSGAYYASSLATRNAIDVNGYIVLAGGWAKLPPGDEPATRAPIFVGVSAADPGSANHSRALAGALTRARWPSRVESRNTGHGVDRAFMAHGISWLRARSTSTNRLATK